MKLSPEVQALIDQPTPAEGPMLAEALRWARQGWPVFPLQPGRKEPHRGSRGVLEATRDEAQIRKWWSDSPDSNIGGACTGRLVVDIDGEHSLPLPTTRVHRTGRGLHFIYAAPEGSAAAAVRPKPNEFGPKVDSRAGSGSYIVLPPSLHPDGGRYEVDNGEPEHALADEELRALYDHAGRMAPAQVRGAQRGISAVTEGPREALGRPAGTPGFRLLSELLGSPPAEGGRNDWLASVCGHFAKHYRDKFDVYAALVALANSSMPQPLDEPEMLKTRDSIWRGEQERHDDREREMSASTGWLEGNGRVLFVRVEYGQGEDKTVGTEPVSNFDIEALGLAIDERGQATYRLRLRRDDGTSVEGQIDASQFGDERALAKWFAAYRCRWDMPTAARPAMSARNRLAAYIDAQEPPQIRIVPRLGWDEQAEGFVTYDGVIRASGFQTISESGVAADQGLRERRVAMYHYGFRGTAAEARGVLQEVLTFQEPEPASVFGAWWAAALLRPQVIGSGVQFPILALEATAGTGKSRGFFSLMGQLSGRTETAGKMTAPTFRDACDATRSGIVWIDDATITDEHRDAIRASTHNGTVTLKSQDRTTNAQREMLAAVMLSSEALGLHADKAMVDRSVVVHPGPTSGRKSLRDPAVEQWVDVQALTQRYGSALGLAEVAGWLQQAALGQVEPLLAAMNSERSPAASSRVRETHRVLLAGARLLDALVGHRSPWEGQGGEHYQRVRAWVAAQGIGLEHDNRLTREVLPWVLRNLQAAGPGRYDAGLFTGMPVGAYIDPEFDPTTLDQMGGPRIWFSPTALSDIWEKRQRQVNEQTEGREPIQRQAELVSGPSQTKRIDGGKTVRYRPLLPEYALAVLQRVEG